MTIMEMINEAICDNPEILWASLDLEGEIYNGRVDIPCPIHNGDNFHGLTMYFNEYYGVSGKWKCHTRSCERIFKNSPLGFVRGVLSSRYCNWKKSGDKIYDWSDTIKYLKGLYGIDGESKIEPGEVERKKFIKNCHCVEDYAKEKNYICTRKQYLKAFTTPSTYLQNRGFPKELLDEYDIRHYIGNNYRYRRRTILPVYDDENRWVIGYTGRSEDNREPKWLDCDEFPKATSLFNYSHASEYIRKSHSVVILEGPLDVLRLRQAGIYNAVGIWGASGWNDYKKYLLDKLGVMRVVLALDNDEAGREGTAKILKDTERIYNTVKVTLPDGVNDVGEMDVDSIKELFKGVL